MKTKKEVTEKVTVEVELTEVEKLKAKIEQIKLEQKVQLETLKLEQQKLKDQAKELKLAEKVEKEKLKTEVAKERANKMKELLDAGSLKIKANKSQEVRKLMLDGKTKEEIIKETGYTNKFILDTMWRIEKSLGIR